MPGDYPSYHSLVHILAKKILTRVIKGGVSQSDAIKDVIHYAELNRQQIIHLCAVLQEYGMPYNGDPLDFFYMSEDMGKGFPNTPDGYVVYADRKGLKQVFGAIEDLRAKGFTTAQIVEMNPELKDVVDTMDQVDSFAPEESSNIQPFLMEQIQADAEYFKEVDENLNDIAGVVDSLGGEELAMAAKAKGNIKTAQEADVEEATPENLEALLEQENAPEEEVSVEEDLDAPAEPAAEEEFAVEEDLGGGDITATVAFTPATLEEQLSKAPAWDVNNILSIQAAQNHYENVRKQLESIVFDENIILSEDAIKQYDSVRAKIDEELDNIKEAQKETEKIEEKENDLEDKFGVENVGDVPTEELISEQPTEETIVEEEAPAEAPEEELQVSE